MEKPRYIFTSMTRISPLAESEFQVIPLPKDQWETGDYVVCEVESAYNRLKIEVASGRMVEVSTGDLLVGALGVRAATMEATGSWMETDADGRMHALTGAGLFGKVTSRSLTLSPLIKIKYQGHVNLNSNKCKMTDFVPEVAEGSFTTPSIIVVGTSMSAGKTTVAKMVVRELKKMGLTVLAAKLTGAGRYRDTLSMSDAGADYIYDFVDVGLPSTICPEKDYLRALKKLLSAMSTKKSDVAVIEIGASPLEPYNGKTAIESIESSIHCMILCASDPYAALGVMEAYGAKPDIVSGLATSTYAGIALIEKLCKVTALNLMDSQTAPMLREILSNKLDPVLKIN